jgi:hypothetical protein
MYWRLPISYLKTHLWNIQSIFHIIHFKHSNIDHKVDNVLYVVIELNHKRPSYISFFINMKIEMYF